MTSRLSAVGVVLPRGVGWRQMTSKQRAGVVVRGVGQLVLLVAAIRDLRRRPADMLRGPRALWVVVSCINYLGIGPIAYFLVGCRTRPQVGSATREPAVARR